MLCKIGASGRVIGTKRLKIGDTEIVEIEMPKTPRTHRIRNLDAFGESAPKWTIGRPFEYKADTTTSNIGFFDIRTKLGNNGVTIPKTSRGNFWTLTCGPDVQYNLPRHKLKPIKIGEKIYYKVEKSKMGPGYYNYSTKEPKKLLTFSKTSRDSRIKEDVPGPGYYDVGPKLRRAPRWFAKYRVTKPPVERVIY